MKSKKPLELHNHFVIGLTGGIGSGKSTAGQFFNEFGITVIDADDLSRDAVLPGSAALNAICNYFGNTVINKDNTLNRTALRAIVFNDPVKLEVLEKITHPVIRRLAIERIQRSTSLYTIYTSPLLFETDQVNLVNKTILIDLPTEHQISRASLRDKDNIEQIKKIIGQQMNRADKQALADIIVLNNNSKNDLKESLYTIHNQLLIDAKRFNGSA